MREDYLNSEDNSSSKDKEFENIFIDIKKRYKLFMTNYKRNYLTFFGRKCIDLVINLKHFCKLLNLLVFEENS